MPEPQRSTLSRWNRYRNTTSTNSEQKSAIRQKRSRRCLQTLPKPLQDYSKQLSWYPDDFGLDRMNLRMPITLNHTIQPIHQFYSDLFLVLIIRMASQPYWNLFLWIRLVQPEFMQSIAGCPSIGTNEDVQVPVPIHIGNGYTGVVE